jgi:hypothetical protein
MQDDKLLGGDHHTGHSRPATALAPRRATAIECATPVTLNVTRQRGSSASGQKAFPTAPGVENSGGAWQPQAALTELEEAEGGRREGAAAITHSITWSARAIRTGTRGASLDHVVRARQ